MGSNALITLEQSSGRKWQQMLNHIQFCDINLALVKRQITKRGYIYDYVYNRTNWITCWPLTLLVIQSLSSRARVICHFVCRIELTWRMRGTTHVVTSRLTIRRIGIVMSVIKHKLGVIYTSDSGLVVVAVV